MTRSRPRRQRRRPATSCAYFSCFYFQFEALGQSPFYNLLTRAGPSGCWMAGCHLPDPAAATPSAFIGRGMDIAACIVPTILAPLQLNYVHQVGPQPPVLGYRQPGVA